MGAGVFSSTTTSAGAASLTGSASTASSAGAGEGFFILRDGLFFREDFLIFIEGFAAGASAAGASLAAAAGSAGASLAAGAGSAGASLAVNSEEQGAAAGLVSSCPALGFVAGPICAGALYQIHGPLAPMFSAAVFFVTLIILVLNDRGN